MDWKKFIADMIAQMLGSVSENLLASLKTFAIGFRTECRVTDNPWDDVLADLMCGLLGIPPEKPQG